MGSTIWRLIPGTNNYYASKDGRIQSDTGKRLRILSQWEDSRGYMRVKVKFKGKSTSCSVHRLVALTFIPNPKNKPQVNHKNGNKKDNSVSNLEWNSCAENVKHSWETGLSTAQKGENHPNSTLNEKKVYAIRIMYSTDKFTINELASLFDTKKSTVHAVLKNRNWSI